MPPRWAWFGPTTVVLQPAAHAELQVTMMKYGISLSTQFPVGMDTGDAVDELIDQVRFVRDAGFDAVFCPQHFLSTPYQMLQPVPLIARLSGEAGTMRLGAGILLVTLLNPLEVAENVATLDAITRGRMILGVGLGYRSEEMRAFGVTGSKVRLFVEKLQVIRRLLEGEAVTAEGSGYALKEASLILRPTQEPRPPIWMAATKDDAVRRAAESADTWMVSPLATLKEVERQVAVYQEELGRPPATLPVIRETCVAETDEEALDVARPFLHGKYKAYIDWGQSEAMAESDRLHSDWSKLWSGRFILGNPDTALREILRCRETIKPSHLIFKVQWPGMPHRDAMRTLELLVNEVLPRVEAHAGKAPAVTDGSAGPHVGG